MEAQKCVVTSGAATAVVEINVGFLMATKQIALAPLATLVQKSLVGILKGAAAHVETNAAIHTVPKSHLVMPTLVTHARVTHARVTGIARIVV